MENHGNFLRSAGAILGGFFAGAILSLGADEILHRLNVFPPWGQPMDDDLFWMPTVYRLVFNVIGCYLAARWAPNKPLEHALVIGCLGFFLGLAGTLATWDHVPPLGPHWYSIVILVSALPCAWLGGSLYLREKH